MRVLMLSDLYPPYVGGIEQHVRNLSQALARRGHDIAIATMEHPDAPSRETDQGVEIYRLRGLVSHGARVVAPSGQPFAPPFPDPLLTAALRRIVLRHRPDVVHGHNWLLRSFLPLKSRSRAKIVSTLHDYGEICAKRSFLYRDRACEGPGPAKCLGCAATEYGAARGVVIAGGNWATVPFNRRAVDMFLPVSAAVARASGLAERHLTFTVVPNFIPDELVKRTDFTHPDLAALPKGPYWLYVGTLTRHKGIHVLLEAYRGLDGVPPLVIIGPRSSDTPKDFPPNVVAINALPHPAVMAAWSRCSLALVPSIFPDPCPTVAMEAMACAAPVIGTRVGGLPDIVLDGETGVLVPPGDAMALRQALRQLANDPGLAHRMGQSGARRVAAFSATAVVTQIDNVYRALVAGSETNRLE